MLISQIRGRKMQRGCTEMCTVDVLQTRQEIKLSVMSRNLRSPLGSSSAQLHKIMQKCRSEQMKPMQTLIERWYSPVNYINSSMPWARTQGTYSRSVKTDLSLKHSVAMGHSILEYEYYFTIQSTRDTIEIYDVDIPSSSQHSDYHRVIIELWFIIYYAYFTAGKREKFLNK